MKDFFPDHSGSTAPLSPLRPLLQGKLWEFRVVSNSPKAPAILVKWQSSWAKGRDFICIPTCKAQIFLWRGGDTHTHTHHGLWSR